MHRDKTKVIIFIKLVFLTAGNLIVFILQHNGMHIVKTSAKSQ
jgi:hypothetical protein